MVDWHHLRHPEAFSLMGEELHNVIKGESCEKYKHHTDGLSRSGVREIDQLDLKLSKPRLDQRRILLSYPIPADYYLEQLRMPQVKLAGFAILVNMVVCRVWLRRCPRS